MKTMISNKRDQKPPLEKFLSTPLTPIPVVNSCPRPWLLYRWFSFIPETTRSSSYYKNSSASTGFTSIQINQSAFDQSKQIKLANQSFNKSPSSIHQSMSVHINPHQSTSIHINPHQSTSIHINIQQSTSIYINPH